MKLTKDEARILATILTNGKYEVLDSSIIGLYDALTDLENRLIKSASDYRRIGRTSQDDFIDCLKRFVKAKNK